MDLRDEGLSEMKDIAEHRFLCKRFVVVIYSTEEWKEWWQDNVKKLFVLLILLLLYSDKFRSNETYDN